MEAKTIINEIGERVAALSEVLMSKVSEWIGVESSSLMLRLITILILACLIWASSMITKKLAKIAIIVILLILIISTAFSMFV